jgi:hypothetical protein
MEGKDWGDLSFLQLLTQTGIKDIMRLVLSLGQGGEEAMNLGGGNEGRKRTGRGEDMVLVFRLYSCQGSSEAQEAWDSLLTPIRDVCLFRMTCGLLWGRELSVLSCAPGCCKT